MLKRWLLLFFCVATTCGSAYASVNDDNIRANKTSTAHGTAQGATVNYQPSIRTSINQLLRKEARNLNIGIRVQSMRSGHVLYERNANRFYVPASILKLLTATASLLRLGSDFHFRTTVWTAANDVKRNQIAGNLYIQFDGDPELTYDDIGELFMKLKEQGIKKIRGDIILVDRGYGRSRYGPGWMWDELNFCYAAPVGSIILNRNCLHAKLQPSTVINSPAELVIDHKKQLPNILDSHVKTAGPDTPCQLDLKVSANHHYQLTGCVIQTGHEIPLAIAIRDPLILASHMIQSSLSELNIKHRGAIREGDLPEVSAGEELQIVAYHDSPPLGDIIASLLKDSDNLVADSLLKKLGEVYFNEAGTWENGTRAMVEILKEKTKIDFNKSKLVDGAGLSRYDLITPKQISQLLYYAYHNLEMAPELMAALPIAGQDGTLKDRLQSRYAKGRVRAKTGTMEGVTALAGFAQLSEHEPLSFVIMMNGFVESPDKYKSLEDKICRILLRR